jgi:hypothetical protein
VLAGLTLSDYIGAKEYAYVAGGACRSYALDAYPWNDVAASAEAGGGR